MFKLVVALLLACISTTTREITTSEMETFAQLPRGTYRYTTVSNEENRLLLLRKSGSVVIGVNLLSDRTGKTSIHHCFRGQAEGDRILYVTQVAPPYDPISHWESGQVIDMADWVKRDRPPIATEQTALETCLQLFWR